MEIISSYSIVLEPLERETIETVRKWRNQTEINQFMEFQDEISKADQLRWFEKVQNENSEYYIIKKGDCEIGLIHLHNLDFSSKSGEAGLFIGNNKYNGTGITLGASLALLDHAFEDLKLETILAKVKNSNLNAIKYNQLLGFVEFKPYSNDFTIFKLKKDRFYEVKPVLLQLLQ